MPEGQPASRSQFAPPPRTHSASGSFSCHVPIGGGGGKNTSGHGAIPAWASSPGSCPSAARPDESMPQLYSCADEEEPTSPVGGCSADEELNTWRKSDLNRTRKPPQVPRLDLTAIHRNAGQRGEPAFLNSHQWRAPAAGQTSKAPAPARDSKMPPGFAAATPEDQQRIAEFYGYRDEGFVATMHGLRTDLIRPRLYVGTMADAAYWPLLKALGITHILNCAVEAQRSPPPYESHGINYMLVPLYDSLDQAQLLQRQRFRTLRECTKFIQAVLKGSDKRTSILVHCVQGLSRSAMVTVAYLMEYEGLELDRALKEVRFKHAGCLQAQHWLSLLHKYDAQVLAGL